MVLMLGLNVMEVAHDMQLKVTQYVTMDLGLLTSYDTWHGDTILI